MRTAYETYRAGSARQTLICLHSSGASGAQWKALAECAPHGVEVLTPDLHGHGAGPAWPGPATDVVAADTARIAVLAAAAEGDVHLVGHSYGGAIALRVALCHPDRVCSVAVYEPGALRVLFDENPRHPGAIEVASAAAAMQCGLDTGNLEGAAASFVDYWSGTSQWARMPRERQLAIMARMPVVLAHFFALAHDRFALRDYAGIDVPVLYLSGRHTRASAWRIARLMERTLPFVEAHTLDGMGHLGPVTHAEAVAGRIASFVGRQIAVRAVPERAAA